MDGAACVACPTGQDCVGGECVCDATSCPTGCCDANGVCQPGDTNAACGYAGVACTACTPAGNNCESGECTTLVWTDPTTGYVWQNGATVGQATYTWAAAQTYCTGLSWGGYTGWRLPDINELRSLIQGCAGTETGGSCDVTDGCLDLSCQNAACEGCSSLNGPASGGAYWPPELSGAIAPYWSSSAVADAGGLAWIVGFDTGGVGCPDTFIPGFARCIR
jgi:hypothetical protein